MYTGSIHYYVQGRFEPKTDALYPALRAFRYKKGSILNDTYRKQFLLSVCGTLVIGDQPVIIFPKGYQPDEKDIRNDAGLLLRTFVQYLSDKDTEWDRVLSPESGEDEENATSSIPEILFILNDYRQNGALVRKHTRISQTHEGRILWTKTLQRTRPLFSHRQAIYPEPYMKSEVRTRRELVQQIHRYLVCKFRAAWGWLYGDAFPKERIPVPPCSKETALGVLRAELRQTFVQREIGLIRCMIRYFQKKTQQEEGESSDLMLTFDFHWIWEHICGQVLGNVYEDVQSVLLPQPVFEGTEKHSIGGQIPDILCLRGRKLYVLDAKYYDHRKNIPGWPDYTKQFFYFYTIRERLAHLPDSLPDFREITASANVLLLPETLQGATSPRFLGTVSLPWSPSLGKIHLFLLDIRRMMQAYLDHSLRKKVQEHLFAAIDQKQAETGTKR